MAKQYGVLSTEEDENKEKLEREWEKQMTWKNYWQIYSAEPIANWNEQPWLGDFYNWKRGDYGEEMRWIKNEYKKYNEEKHNLNMIDLVHHFSDLLIFIYLTKYRSYCVLYTVLNALQILIHLIITTPKSRFMSIFVLKMKGLRHKRLSNLSTVSW